MTDAADDAASAPVPGPGAGVRPPADSLPVLVLGYGNTLRRDDGVGVCVADAVAADARLAQAIRDGRVTVATAHQLTPEVALDFAAASLVVLVDAAGQELPGAIGVYDLSAPGPADASVGAGEGADRSRPGSSSHHVDAAELLALARELTGATPRAVGIGIGVADLELGEGLSEPVQAAVPRAVDAVVGIVSAHLA